MPLVSDRCICLRTFEFSETSQILTLLARSHGIVRVIAKGAHRRTKAGSSRFDGGVDLLDAGSALFTDDSRKELATLAEWKLQEGHLELRREIRSLHLAMYAAELASMLFEEHDPHPDLFDRLTNVIPELATARREEAFLSLQIEMLREAGYLPEFGQCASCGQPTDDREADFSPSASGLVCRDCRSAHPDRLSLDPRLLRMLRGILQLPQAANSLPARLPKLTRHQTDPLNKLLAEHVTHTLNRPLRMQNYVIPRINGAGTMRAGKIAPGSFAPNR
jgi:DNA repair protein RecO (recombination protein O)